MSFVADGPRQGFSSVAPRALLVCTLCILTSIATVMILHRLLIALSPSLAGPGPDIQFWCRVQGGLLAGMILGFLYFLAGCRHNLAPLGVQDADWPVLTAVVLWALPVVNLFFAAILLAEAWRGSDPARPQSLFTNWRQSPGTGMIPLWLVMLVVSSALLLAAAFDLLPRDGVGLLNPAVLLAVGNVLLLIALILLAVLVSRLSRRQDRRATRGDVAALPAWAR